MEELKEAIRLKNEKAPGYEKISVEMIKYMVQEGIEILLNDSGP